MSELEDRIAQLEEKLKTVHEYVDSHVGQSWGSANPQWPHGTPVFPFREIHTLSRQSINNGFPITFTVDYDEFIAKLHSAKLRLTFYNVRSNVTAASSAAGGGTTVASTGGSNHSHTVSGGTAASGGAQTASGGSSHTHSVTGQTVVAGTDNFTVALPESISIDSPSPASTQDVSQGHTHTFSGSPTDNQNQGHTHSLNDHGHDVSFSANILIPTSTHTHSFSTFTSGGEAAHTHTVSDHTHSLSGITAANEGSHTHNVTLIDHTHTITLTYGIFEQAYSNPGLSITINGVDRTSALGGPWNVAPGVLDITQYLRETSGEPLRGANTIVFTVASSLLDIEATLKSVALPSNLLVAGL